MKSNLRKKARSRDGGWRLGGAVGGGGVVEVYQPGQPWHTTKPGRLAPSQGPVMDGREREGGGGEMAFGSQRAPQGRAERIEMVAEKERGMRKEGGGEEKSHREAPVKPPAPLTASSLQTTSSNWMEQI